MSKENSHTDSNPTPTTSNVSNYGESHASMQLDGGLGLAIASLVLGILAVVLSLLLIGGLLGAVGLILGFVHLKGRRKLKGMAWWGVCLSLFGLLVSIGFGLLYYQGYKQFEKAMETMDSSALVTEWEGVVAPDFTVITLDGQKIVLSELKGKRVLLDFWTTWCPPCRKEIPHFIQLAKDISSNDLCIVGISSENVETLKKFVQKAGINYPIASAKDLPAPYSEIRSIPTTFFIDRNGIIQTVVVGYHDLATLKSYAMDKDYEGEPKLPPAPKSQNEIPAAVK